jgi:hypothetical protein
LLVQMHIFSLLIAESVSLGRLPMKDQVVWNAYDTVGFVWCQIPKLISWCGTNLGFQMLLLKILFQWKVK